MRLEALRGRLDKLAREMPSLASSEGGPRRNAARLERIAAETPGPRRDLTIRLAVAGGRFEEPSDFQALIDAIGPERIAAVYPDGAPAVEPDASLRARARADHAPAGYVCRIATMLREQIAREAVAP